jgi:hypothetical protein
MRGLRRRALFFFKIKQKYWLVVTLVGIVLAVIAGWLSQAHTVAASVVGGIGASVLATVIVSFAGPAGDEAYQRFLSLGVINFYSNRDNVPKNEWVDRLGKAKERCILLGQAHGNWCRDLRFRPALVDRLTNGVQVEMFFLNPKETAAELRSKEDIIRDTRDSIRRSLKEVWDIREGLQEPAKERLTLWVYNATASLGVTWVDAEMLVTHYLAGAANVTSPALLVQPRPGSDTPYAVYSQNVNKIRANFSIKVTSANIAAYTHEETDGHAP